MFNRAKTTAKRLTWHHLRNAQKLALKSKLGADPRIDSRKLMVSLGALGIYMSLFDYNDISTAQKDKFMTYIYERAPKDIHDLLAEFKLEQLDSSCFKRFYSDLTLTCVNAGTKGEEVFPAALIQTIHYALKDDFCDDENFNYILDNYKDEILLMGQKMLS